MNVSGKQKTFVSKQQIEKPYPSCDFQCV